MKKALYISLGVLISVSTFVSCKKDNADYSTMLPNAIVTVKPIDDKSFYLQLDDKTALLPVNDIDKLPFGQKEVRAFVNYSKADMPKDADKEKFAGAVKINWLDSLLTKPTKPSVQDNNVTYGNDPVEIYNNWMTVVEDGYLTINFTTIWGNRYIKHEVNLLTGVNPEDPYEVEFRHNAFGDTYGTTSDGIVAFRLSDLPDTEGETVKLTLKWNSFKGEKKVQFDYCTRAE